MKPQIVRSQFSALLASTVAVVSLLLLATPLHAVEVLESPALRLELNTSPYSFRVVEKATGKVLLQQSNTSYRFEFELFPVTEADGIVKDAKSLQANLHLQFAGRLPLPSGTPDHGQVTFTFVRPDTLQVLLQYKGGAPAEISEEFDDHGEHYYGIWEYPAGGQIDNRGADRDFLGMRNERYVHHSSARAPFYMTSGRYGIYVESLAEGHFSVAQAGKTSFSFRERQLKYNIIYGGYAEVLNRYNAMAGPAYMPPLWAFGTIWWRDDHHEDLRGVSNAQEKVIQDADKLRALHWPATAIWLDRPYASGPMGWGNMDFDSSFPDPAGMVRALDQRGMNLLLWVANRNSGKIFDEGKAKGYLFDGEWPAADMRRTEVYDWFKGKLDPYVRLGVKGYKIDRGDEDEMPRSVENLNAVLFPKMAFEGVSEVHGRDTFLFSRNANDTARRYTSIWSGDPWNTFSGLQMAIKNGQRSGAINFPMWGSDSGGYFSVPSKELFARWLEFGAFSPMMEVLLGPKRTIWDDFDSELVSIAGTYVNLHHDLIPYTRSALYHATQTGMPVMRSLVFAFPNDRNVTDTWDEYMYGDALLVAPVTEAGAVSRTVYLPEGRWLDYNDRSTTFVGPKTITVAAPLGTIPLFVREGAIIPRGDILKANNNWTADWKPRLRIEIFPSSSAPGSTDYFDGTEGRRISLTRKGNDLEIALPELGTDGELEVYCRSEGAVLRSGQALRQGSDYTIDAQKHLLRVPFHGTTTVVVRDAGSVFERGSNP